MDIPTLQDCEISKKEDPYFDQSASIDELCLKATDLFYGICYQVMSKETRIAQVNHGMLALGQALELARELKVSIEAQESTCRAIVLYKG